MRRTDIEHVHRQYCSLPHYGESDYAHHLPSYRGMTVVELMVTILIITILSATLCVFLVKLINVHEQEREEAYVREKLVAISGVYADYLSVASSIGNDLTISSLAATYRQETGGVSLETGRVKRVTHLFSKLSNYNTIDLDAGHFEMNQYVSGFAREIRGDALLLPQTNDLIVLRGEKMITPLDNSQIEDAHLVYLQISARCKCKDSRGVETYKNVTMGRIVRLWNKE